MLLSMMGLILSLIIPLAVMLIFTLMSLRSNMDREKSSPFECGFDPNHNSRIPFSMRFFLLAIIFLVFDIEIVLLMPIPLTSFQNSQTLMGVQSFLLILILGLLHEWNQGSLNWSNWDYPESF